MKLVVLSVLSALTLASADETVPGEDCRNVECEDRDGHFVGKFWYRDESCSPLEWEYFQVQRANYCQKASVGDGSAQYYCTQKGGWLESFDNDDCSGEPAAVSELWTADEWAEDCQKAGSKKREEPSESKGQASIVGTRYVCLEGSDKKYKDYITDQGDQMTQYQFKSKDAEEGCTEENLYKYLSWKTDDGRETSYCGVHPWTGYSAVWKCSSLGWSAAVFGVDEDGCDPSLELDTDNFEPWMVLGESVVGDDCKAYGDGYPDDVVELECGLPDKSFESSASQLFPLSLAFVATALAMTV